MVVRFPAGPRVGLKTVDPPKGNGLGQKKSLVGGSKVFNPIIQMEADHLRENPQTPQQQETLQAIT